MPGLVGEAEDSGGSLEEGVIVDWDTDAFDKDVEYTCGAGNGAVELEERYIETKGSMHSSELSGGAGDLLFVLRIIT